LSFIAVVVEGVILGLNYGLLALGLTLVYRTTRVVNFAQGQLGVVAAVFFVKEYYDFHLFYLPALLIAIGLAAAAAALSELLLRRLFNRPRVLVMVATIGLSQVLYLFTVLPFIRPKKLFRPFPVPFHLSFHIGTFRYPPGDVLTLMVAPVVALGLALFVRRSPWGLAMRAMSENAESARLSGVWVRRTSTVAWTVAGILSAFTAFLASPGQTSALTQVLGPDLLLLGLLAALLGGMSSLPIAFAAGVGVGVVQEVLQWNITNPSTGPATIELILFVLLQAALLVRAASLDKGTRKAARSSWASSTAAFRHVGSAFRQRVGSAGVGTVLAIAVVLPLVIGVGRSFLMSQICIYAVIALSLTVLTGWAGQVSLGQFGLVAVGTDLAAHLSPGIPLIGLMAIAGVVTALVSVVVGLTALRIRSCRHPCSPLPAGRFHFCTDESARACRIRSRPWWRGRPCSG
jgi:branched-subunit amino acid ABC-type transport system permease component